MDVPAPRTKRAQPHSALTDVQVELTFAIFHKLLGTAIMGALGFLWLTALVAHVYHDPWMWNYVKVVTVFLGSRILIIVAFTLRSEPPLTLAAARRWEYLYEAHTLLMCGIMAIGSFHIFQVHDVVADTSCLLGVFCAITAITSRTGMRPWVLQLSTIIAFSTIAYSMARSDYTLIRAVTVLVVLFVLTICRSVNTQFEVWVEQVRGRHKLRELSERDTLTGLANRLHFQQSLDTKCREQTPFAILYIDLDRFKQVNDTLGHAAGDTLLRLVADRLHACLRSSDLLARLGGDEFAIIQSPLLSETSAQQLAERINQRIAESFEIDCHLVSIGASIGIQLALKGTMNPSQLLSTADSALYRVKKAGGGSFSFNSA